VAPRGHATSAVLARLYLVLQEIKDGSQSLLAIDDIICCPACLSGHSAVQEQLWYRLPIQNSVNQISAGSGWPDAVTLELWRKAYASLSIELIKIRDRMEHHSTLTHDVLGSTHPANRLRLAIAMDGRPTCQPHAGELGRPIDAI
jgi:hypothetical protein